MSYKRVCDRCQQVAEPDRQDALGSAIVRFNEGRGRKELDLCGKCARIVFMFIMHGQVPPISSKVG